MSRTRRDRSRGQALTEFALVVPILLLVLFAIVDVGRYVYSWNAINEATRAAARVGSVPIRPASCAAMNRETCVKSITRARLVAVSISTTEVTVECQRQAPNGTLSGSLTNNCGGSNPWQANDIMTVKVSHPFTLLTPIVGQLIDSGNPLLTMKGQTTVTVN